MYVPNVREDSDYNEKYLGEMDSECVCGYDICVEHADNFFNNLEVYSEHFERLDFDTFENLDRDILMSDKDFEDYSDEELNEMTVETKVALCMKQSLLHWLESERDMIVTSMLDNMTDDDYNENKEGVKNGTYKNNLVKREEYLSDPKNFEGKIVFRDENGTVVEMPISEYNAKYGLSATDEK